MPGLLSLRPFASMARADKLFRGGLNEKSKSEGKPQTRGTKSMRSKVLPLQNAAPGHIDSHGEDFVDDKGRINPLCNSGDEIDDFQSSSVCLDNFMLDGIDNQPTGSRNCGCGKEKCCHVAGKVDADEDAVIGKEVLLVLQALIPCTSPRERSLLLDVSMFLRTAQEAPHSGSGDSSRVSLHKKLIMHLRLLGYDAAVCKSRWDHSHGFPGGDYEYLDVVEAAKTGTQNRLFIDIDFRSQFEIARPTADYLTCLQTLPTVFVGQVDRLQQIVDIVSDASRRSLIKRDMHLPPWRKTEYMRAKWLSPYQRVIVAVPVLASMGHCHTSAAQHGLFPHALGSSRNTTALSSLTSTGCSQGTGNDQGEKQSGTHLDINTDPIEEMEEQTGSYQGEDVAGSDLFVKADVILQTPTSTSRSEKSPVQAAGLVERVEV